jgi:predicted CXXCH cytochrome family protein
MRPGPWTLPLRLAILAMVTALAGSRAPATQGTPLFPHERHARLFPVCEGCHAGILTGVSDSVYPRQADCQQCHDGLLVQEVPWREPAPRLSNLRFSHTGHRQRIDSAGDTASCLTCHAISDPARRMVVAGPNPALCVRCHAHQEETHLARGAVCRSCHVPIAGAAAITPERIAGFPRPAWHDTADFSSGHGRVGGVQSESCAICHARETCERCHANAERLPRITRLARDGRVARLEAGKPAIYVAPPTHGQSEWRQVHGREAVASAESCANCHTRPSCETCHVSGIGSSRVVIQSLPGPGVREGLGVRATRIERLHPVDFASRHSSAAATGGLTCAECHTEETCTGCHAAADSRRFHADNFIERHAVDVFASGADCQSCHNTERFCRECHARTGIASDGRLNAAFHTGKANWVLSHGQAARTGMESCAACHKQADCVRCHSASGGWGVNPHGAGFQANARARGNAASCRWCHIGALPRGGT